ncbi:Squalene synthase [Oopsacas minuta]|uniref:Squalene synthase n=1 Tax=Oopsacas minuta TaxID=111878 RepID=A0AAV7K706_9METZ|nr:Squalene synthase [Oopsacas minuta]
MGSCMSCRRDRGLLEGTEVSEITLGNNKLFIGQPVWEGGTDVTRDTLEEKRIEFWETAPAFGGQEEVWSALRSATEFAERGDYSMAQAIIDGVGIILPNGYLSQSYDERGHQYVIPNYCLARPKSPRRHAYDPGLSPSRKYITEDEELKIELDTKIRIRLDGRKDIKLEVNSEDTIISCKRRLSLVENVSVSSQLWCHSGKVLKNSQILREVNIPCDHMVQQSVTFLMEFYVSMYHPSELWALFRYKYLGGNTLLSPQLTTEELQSADLMKCYEYLELTSRSFSAVIRSIQDNTLRPAVCIFYLVLRALDTIEDDMNIPIDDKVTMLSNFYTYLQIPDWRYKESTEKDRIVLEDFPTISRAFRGLPIRYQRVINDIAGQMGRGFAGYLEKRIVTVEEWDEYCLYAAGLVGVGLTNLFTSGTEVAHMTELSIGMGRFLQKTNITRDYFEDTTQGRHFWPEEVWHKYGDTIDTFKQPENVAQGVACLNHLITLTLTEVPNVLEYLAQLGELTNDNTVFNFCAIPQVMAIATLLLCYNNKNVFKKNVKIRKGETVSLMQEATSMKGVKTIFSEYAQLIKNKIQSTDPSAQETARICNIIIQKCNIMAPNYAVTRYTMNSSVVLIIAIISYRYNLHSRAISSIQGILKL